MAELVKMKRGFSIMNVPPARVQEFAEEGWTELERVQMTGDVASQEKPAGKKAAETDDKTPVKADDSASSKSKKAAEK